jgi:hypothetical protein
VQTDGEDGSRQDLGHSHRFRSSNRQRRHRCSELHSAAEPHAIGPGDTLSLGVALLLSALGLATKRRTELLNVSSKKTPKSTASHTVTITSKMH